jgi:hypothetical protein
VTTVTPESSSEHAATEPAARSPLMTDPTPVAFALFAFALAVYFIRYQDVNASTLAAGPITEGLNYAVLVAGIAEVLAGILGIIRGIGYPAYVTTTFGIWLLGFYLLITSGAASKEFTPDAIAWYSLVLIVPVAILAVPAFVHRNIPFTIAFVALLVLLLFLGLGYHSLEDQLNAAAATKSAPDLATAVDQLKVSAWAGLVAAVAIWVVFAQAVFQATGVMKRPSE